jgi:quercetin dioxygenase-like cupin family protein
VKEGVRVSEFELQPGAVIPSHHHGGPHLVVALTDYELRSDVKGKGSRIITMKRGEIQWAAGGYSHILTNTGDHPARFITLEFR